MKMTINEGLRLAAGIFTLLSVLLALSVDMRWLWFTGFIGANQLQSAFTHWCPMMWLLGKLGLQREVAAD